VRGTIPGQLPCFFTRVGDSVYFFAQSSFDSAGLWKTDGTAAGTTFIEPLEPPVAGFGPPAEALRPGVLGSRFFLAGAAPWWLGHL